ncbi:MAG: glycosyltransferase family 4 protein [Ignavibacteria bacterium]
MKVIYVTYDSFLDHSYTIIKELRKNCELKVFMISRDLSDELAEWCKKTDAEFVKRKRFRNPLSMFDSIRLMRRIKKTGGIVWFNTLSAYPGILARLMLKNFLVMVHDVEYHPDSKDYYSFISLWLAFKILKWKISVASNTQAAIFQSKYGIKPKVFQLPVIDYYKDAAESKNYNQKSSGSMVKFFFFGSIEPYKGIEILLDAAEVLEKKNIDFKLNIYGKLKYSDSILSNRINNLKNVTLYNRYVDYKNVHTVYCENDILILPYKQVTQCGPLLIGYSEGVPSICNDLEGFREYVVEGRSGEFFNGTASNLAEKMEGFINNKRKITEMSEFIMSEIYNKFSMESLVNEYIENFK